MCVAVAGCLHASAPRTELRSPVPAVQVALAPAQVTAIDALMSRATRTQHLAGASLAIGIGGIPVFARGYGYRDLARRLPATPETIYNIASMSKQFVAASILMLQGEGKLDIDDPIAKYVPGIPHGDKITIHEVLDHTSGLSDYLDLIDNNTLTPARVHAALRRLTLRFPPGTRYEYSNSNYIIAGLVVEKASGMPYDEFVRSRIIGPLGLRSTTLGTSPLDLPNGSVGYTVVHGRTIPVDPHADSTTILDFPDGAINSTVLDLIAWDDALDTGRVITPDLLKIMFTPSPRAADWPGGYALGVGLDSIDGRVIVAHTGGWSGFTGENATIPSDRIAVILLTNTDTFDYEGKSGLIRRILKLLTSEVS
jgi:CubicO group peptidase (beta-lactamase class C family)